MTWPESSPSHPKAWQVGQYLKSYVSKCDGIDIRTSREVVKAFRPQETPSSIDKRWAVEVESTSTHNSQPTPITEKSEQSRETHYFDHLIVASGFFGKPKLPSNLPSPDEHSVPILHSTQFRSIKDLLTVTEGKALPGDKILVVGGSMSGVEVAASIAVQLSAEAHALKPSQINDVSKYRIHHVTHRPFWVLPLFLPSNPTIKQPLDDSKVCSLLIFV
jgi:cation diffusion facilitator CzcD-associated flavoprotein CzcO